MSLSFNVLPFKTDFVVGNLFGWKLDIKNRFKKIKRKIKHMLSNIVLLRAR